MSAKVPEICDYDCPHADFPPAETAGICRTMSAVWCGKLKELVNKNTPCEWHKRQASRPSRTRGKQPKRSTAKKKATGRKKVSRRKRA